MPLLSHIPRVEARAAILSLVVGISLLIIKYIAYFLTSSAAIFSDATESIANVLASAVALYSLVVAHRPADAEHPYGHGKVEFISAWFEASLIMAAAVFIIIKTIDALYHGVYATAESALEGIILMTAAMLVNGVVGLYLIRTGRRQNSLILIADGKHLLTDVWTSVGVLVALGLVKLTGYSLIDPIAAFVVAGYIAFASARLLRHAAAGIMDKQDLEDERLITGVLDSHCGAAGALPKICNYHKLRHRHSGRYHWVDFHIRLPEEVNVRTAHEVATAIELEIEAALGEGNATAHVEPCDRSACQGGKCLVIDCPSSPGTIPGPSSDSGSIPGGGLGAAPSH